MAATVRWPRRRAVRSQHRGGACARPHELREHLAQRDGCGNLRSLATPGQRRLARGGERQELQRPVGDPRQARHERVRRAGEQHRRTIVLQQLTRAHHRHLAAEAKRLVHVVGHQHDGRAEAALDVQQIFLRLGADDGIERTEGLVHEQHRGLRRQRARDADALLLATGELVRKGVGVGARVELKHPQQLLHPRADARRLPPEQARARLCSTASSRSAPTPTGRTASHGAVNRTGRPALRASHH